MPSIDSSLAAVFSKPPVFAELFNQFKHSHPEEAEWSHLYPDGLHLRNPYWLQKHPCYPSGSKQTVVLMEDMHAVYLLALEADQDRNIPFSVWHWGMCLDGYPQNVIVDPEPSWHYKKHYILVGYVGTETYTSSRKFTDAMHPDDLPLPPGLQDSVELYVQLVSLTDQSASENAAYQTELRELAEALRLARGKTRAEIRNLVRTHPLFRDMDADVARLLADLLHVAYPEGDEGAKRLNLAQGEVLYAESCLKSHLEAAAS